MSERFPNSGPIWEKKFEKGWGKGKRPDSHVLDFIEKYKNEIGPDILDIGSGEGRHLIPLAKKGYSLTGLELTKEGIKITKTKMGKEEIEADLVRGNFSSLPFKENSFDTAISVQAMQHNNWKGAEAAFSEAARILKPGGLFFLRVNSDKHEFRGNEKMIDDKGITWSRDEEGHPGIHHSFSFEEFEELAGKYNLDIEPGFVDEKKVVDGVVVTRGQWNIVFRKKKDEK